jgi:opacity protein-like surface antigen
MRSLLVSTAIALTVLGAAVPAVAAASPANPSVQAATSGVTPAAYHQRGHGRAPRSLRGFDDPGYAYHGNINGCAEDLGYGRWESCDSN